MGNENDNRLVRNSEFQAKKYNEEMISEPGYKHTEENGDKYRLKLQICRDRILWSSAFKRLAHKTQIFPQQYGDHHRRRLTHTLEVLQLSTSIARTLGLNTILCEAIALAHDIGHTPFGHAGEDAIHSALSSFNVISNEKYHIKGLNSFTHYEQGVDVVHYVETKKNWVKKERIGLDLEKVIEKGILRHMYSYDSTSYGGLKYLEKKTKYPNCFVDPPGPGSGVPEIQTVRVCDKISYLVSDIEDGIRIGAIHNSDIKRICKIIWGAKKGKNADDSKLYYTKDYFLSIRNNLTLQRNIFVDL